jgi:hypothetical protein
LGYEGPNGDFVAVAETDGAEVSIAAVAEIVFGTGVAVAEVGCRATEAGVAVAGVG